MTAPRSTVQRAPDVTVEMPDRPPAITPRLARLLLRIVRDDNERSLSDHEARDDAA